MDVFEKDYYKLTRMLLSSVGLWPYQNWRTVALRRFFVFFIFTPVPFLLVFKLYSPEISTIVFTEVILIFIVTIIVLLKFLNHCINIQKIKTLIEYMKNDWETLRNEDEIKMLKKYSTIGQRYNLFCTTFCYLNTCIFMVLPLISPALDYFVPRNETRPRQHPFEAEYFVNKEEYFFPILFHMYIVLMVVITVVVATDAIYITCIFHVCGMFSIVGSRLEHACSNISQTTFVYNKHCAAHKNVVSAVRYHWKTVKFSNAINNSYGWAFFIILVLIVISISITLFNAAIALGEWKEMMLALIFFTGQMAQVFFNVYPAQCLIDLSSKIFTQTYNSLWYMAPVEIQRSILIIMQRCMSECPLVVGKLIVVSMEMYAMVVQTSMSYFTALYSLNH